MRSFHAMQGTIHAYTSYILNAFRQMAGASANLKITVKCSFLKES